MALTACIILLCLALALSFYPIFPGAVPAYLAMFSLKWAGLQYSHDFSNSTLTFWGIAVFIVLGITSLLPKPLANPHVGWVSLPEAQWQVQPQVWRYRQGLQ